MKVTEVNQSKLAQPAQEQNKNQQNTSGIKRGNTGNTSTGKSIVNHGKEANQKKEIDEAGIQERKTQEQEKKKFDAKQKRGALQRQFELIIDLLKIRKVSIEQAYLEVAVAFAQLVLSNMRRYEELVSFHYSIDTTSLTTVTKVLSYLDITSLLKMSLTLYNICLIVFSSFCICLPLLYISCTAMYYIYPKMKVRKFFYGRWFVLSGDIFLWVLLQPFIMTMVSYLTCPSILVNNLGLKCDSSESFYTLKIAVAISGLVISFFTIWFLSYFFFNGGFSTKKDALACDNTINVLIFSFYRVAFSILITLSYDSYTFFLLLLLFNLLSTSFLAYLFILHSGLLTFRNKYIRNLFQSLTIVLFSQSVAFSLDEFIRKIQVIGSQDRNSSTQITVVIVVLSFFTFRSIRKSEELRYISSNDVRNLSYLQFKKKIYYIQRLLENSIESIFSDNYFKGLISQHLNFPCQNQGKGSASRCFCQLKGLHDSKKNKDIMQDRYFLSTNKNILCKFIIKSWYQQFILYNPQDFTAIIDYSEFVFNKLRNSCVALQNVMFLRNKFLYPTDSYRKFRLFQYIHKVNKKKNISSYKSLLDVENVIPIEEKIDRIKYKIKKILSANADFWGMLLKSVVNLQECNETILKVLQEINTIKKMWLKVIVYLNHREKWRFYFAWYTLYILNLKVSISLLEKFSGFLVNENEIFFEEFQTDQLEDDVGSVSSNMKDDQDKINIKKIEMAFDRRSSVFRVSNDPGGKIIKVNKPVLTTFGFTRHELENNLSVTDLMPRSFAISHPKQTANYISTGKSKVLYNQKKIYCVMKKGDLFSAWKFLKLYVTAHGDTEFVSLIRPILNPTGSKVNYIIINEDWEVDAMTQQVYELFLIDSEIYRQHMVQLANFKFDVDKTNDGERKEKLALTNLSSSLMILNILLLIPKLIKFSKLAQFLTVEDQHHFGIIQKKENLGGLFNMLRFNNDKNRQQGFQRQGSDKSNGLRQHHINKMKELTIKMRNPEPKHNEEKETIQIQIKQSNQSSLPAVPQKVEDGSKSPFLKPRQNNLLISTQPQADQSSHLLNTHQPKPKENMETQKSKDLIDDLGREDSLKRVSSASISSVRRSSFLDMNEQLHGNLQSQEEIKKLMERGNLKKKTQIGNSDNAISDENDDTSGKKDGSQTQQEDIDDFESDFGQDIFDQSGKKVIDERLEKGDQLSFVARVPLNIQQMMQSYYIMTASRLKKYEDQEAKKDLDGRRSSMKFKSMRTSMNSISQKSGSVRKLPDIPKEEMEPYFQRDKALYQLLKDTYTLHLRRKKINSFQMVCSIKFKKVGGRKIGIMKIFNLEQLKSAKQVALQQQEKLNQIKQQNLAEKDKIPSPIQNSFHKQNSYGKRDSLGNPKPQGEIVTNVSKFQKNNSIQIGSSLTAVSANQVNENKTQNINNQLLQLMNPSTTASNQKNVLTPMYSMNSQQYSYQDPTENYQSDVARTDIKPEKQDISKENGMGYQVNYLITEDEKQPINNIQKDFDKKQGTVTFNLSSADNIFIKEDIHEPRSKLFAISQMQVFTRIIFLLIICFNIFTCFLGVNTYFQTISSQSSRVYMAKNLHLKVLSGYNNLLDQLILNANNFTNANLASTYYTNQQGMQLFINQTFINLTSYFQSTITDMMLQEMIFDSSLFKSQISSTYILNGLPAKGNYSFDSVDLFNAYIYHINELNNSMYSHADALLIDTNSISVQFLRENVFQYLNDYANSLSQNAINVVSNTMSNISNFTFIVIIVLTVLVIVSLILIWRFMKVICYSFTSVIESFLKIDIVDVKRIRSYNLILLHQFNYAVQKDELYSKAYRPISNQLVFEKDKNLNNTLNEEEEYQQNMENLNQKSNIHDQSIHKKHTGKINVLSKISDLNLESSDDNAQIKKNRVLEQGKFLSNLQMRTLLFYGAFSIAVIAFSSAYFLQIYLNQFILEDMKSDGMIIVEPITLNLIMLISLKENCIDPVNYRMNHYQSSSSLVSQFFGLQQDTVLSDQSKYSYNEMYIQVYKNNTCNSDIASSLFTPLEIIDCSSISSKTLLEGINIFQTKYSEYLLDFKSISSLNTYTLPQGFFLSLEEFSRGVYYTNIINTNIMQQWVTDLQSNLSGIETSSTVLIIGASALMLILFLILNEFLILGRFRSEYDHFRTVYNMYFPEAIVVKKKNIKYWLIKHGILKRK